MRYVKIVFALLAVMLLFSSFAVWKYYAATRGTLYLPRLGITHPLSTHGSIVYISTNEYCFLYGLIIAALICFLVAAVVYFIYG